MNKEIRLRALRLLALLEGISYLAFAITMPLKYMYEVTEPNMVVGILHGGLFIMYCLMLFWVNLDRKWSFMTNFWAYLASLLPFGTFVADSRIFKKCQDSNEAVEELP